MNWFQFLTGVYVGGAIVLGTTAYTFTGDLICAFTYGLFWPIVLLRS